MSIGCDATYTRTEAGSESMVSAQRLRERGDVCHVRPDLEAKDRRAGPELNRAGRRCPSALGSAISTGTIADATLCGRASAFSSYDHH